MNSRRDRVDLLIGAAIVASTLAVLLVTSRDFGMAWDEGFTVQREQTLQKWFAFLSDPPAGRSRSEAFRPVMLRHYWRFGREEPDGHPPVYALLGLAGWHVTRGVFSPLTAYRFGPMTLAAVTAGAVYLHLARRVGRLAALTAASALTLMPRLLAHAHYAHYDTPMTDFWLLAQIAFMNAIEAKGRAKSALWRLAFGSLWGLSASTKFTGFLVPIGPVIWVFVMTVDGLVGHAESRRVAVRGFWSIASALPVAGLGLLAVQPPWWHDPARSFIRLVVSNTSRAETIPIPTMYLGRMYAFSLPWHNTIVLTAVTTPSILLVLACIGIVWTIAYRRVQPWALAWPCSWLVLMLVRALPSAPGHDGIRLFLPSIAMLAILAGLGVGWLTRILTTRLRTWIPPLIVAAGLGECLVGVVQLYPYTDSYFSAAIGGLPAARRQGFELIYYWETQGNEFLEWLRTESRKRRVELRFPTPIVTQTYLREWGLWPTDVLVVGLDELVDDSPDYALQSRGGVFLPEDWWLDRHGHPLYSIRRQGVDLLRVFPFEERLKALKATKDEPIPDYLRTIAPPERIR
jgi:hypothetical protein